MSVPEMMDGAVTCKAKLGSRQGAKPAYSWTTFLTTPQNALVLAHLDGC